VKVRDLARLGAGEESLVGLFMERRQGFMRFLLARTGSKPEAEDALQDVYLKLCSAPTGDASEILDPGAYLYRLCLNVVADRRRGRVRAQTRDDAFHKLHTRTEAGDLIADAPSPEAAAEARIRLERILAALETLPPQQKRVFRLHRIQGLSHREISETLGISRSAVEKHMIAALKRLATWEN
jgi:RNA polymerase sigma-70 factor (ECF subfamily)